MGFFDFLKPKKKENEEETNKVKDGEDQHYKNKRSCCR